jgi:FMN phosphatase YigB (HAD superfamily)
MHKIVFDLGGVVFEWDPEKILHDFYADADSRSSMKTAMFSHPDWLEMDRGTIDEPQMVERLHARTGRPRTELAALLEAVRHSLTPKAGTVELIEDLARRGVPLYCLSNMPSSTYAFLVERHAFLKAFHGQVISGDVKMIKPEREIFLHLLERFHLPVSETVFIDDHLPNIEAAKALAIQTIWFRSPDQCRFELDTILAAPLS